MLSQTAGTRRALRLALCLLFWLGSPGLAWASLTGLSGLDASRLPDLPSKLETAALEQREQPACTAFCAPAPRLELEASPLAGRVPDSWHPFAAGERPGRALFATELGTWVVEYANDNPTRFVDLTGHIAILQEWREKVRQGKEWLLKQADNSFTTSATAKNLGSAAGVLGATDSLLGLVNVAGDVAAMRVADPGSDIYKDAEKDLGQIVVEGETALGAIRKDPLGIATAMVMQGARQQLMALLGDPRSIAEQEALKTEIAIDLVGGGKGSSLVVNSIRKGGTRALELARGVGRAERVGLELAEGLAEARRSGLGLFDEAASTSLQPNSGASTKAASSSVQANKAAGDAFRDQVADALEQSGRTVKKEVVKKTPFGPRRVDIEVSKDGKVLGGVETKAGNSPYIPSQRAKDWYLEHVKRYFVDLVRDK